MTSAERAKISDPSVMRALAHPTRLELLDYLSSTEGGATATECAEVVGLSPSATSYHLRALAKVGMIHEGSGRGDGRERVWQASFRNYSVGTEFGLSTPEDLAAELAMAEAFMARQNEKARRYMARIQDEPREWYDSGTITEQTLAVTADELKELLEELTKLTEPLTRSRRVAPPANARKVSFQVRAFPVD